MSEEISKNISIDDYTIKELEEFIELPENYVKSDIHFYIEKTKLNFQNDQNMINFFDDAKDKLLNHVENSNNLILNFNEENKIDETQKLVLLNENNFKFHNRDIIKKSIFIDTKHILLNNNYPYGINPDPVYNFDSTLNGSKSHFKLNLEVEEKEVIQLSLSNLEFSNTWYPLSYELGNTCIYVNDNKIELDPGVIDITKLFDDINAQLTNLDLSCSFVYNLDTTTLGYGTNGKGNVTFNNQNTTTSVTLALIENVDYSNNNVYDDFIQLQRSLGWMLGFRNTKYIVDADSSINSESILDLRTLKYFYILFEDHNNTSYSTINIYNNPSNKLNESSVLSRISVNGSSLENVNREQINNTVSVTKQYNGKVNLLSIIVSLRDEFGNIINLNNGDYSFSIDIEKLNNN